MNHISLFLYSRYDFNNKKLTDIHSTPHQLLIFLCIHSSFPNEYSKNIKTSKSIRIICNIGTYMCRHFIIVALLEIKEIFAQSIEPTSGIKITQYELYIHIWLFDVNMRGFRDISKNFLVTNLTHCIFSV